MLLNFEHLLMKKSIISICVTIVLISCNHKEESYVVQEQIISEAVYASGTILPQEYNFIKSFTTAPILKIYAKEGCRVSKGDILVIIGSSDNSEKVGYAMKQVSIAKDNLTHIAGIVFR